MRSGSPPSRISIARLAGDSAATAALTSPETWAAAIGAPGPATTAVASAADRCFLRLFSRRAFGRSARLRRDRSSERSQSSGVARSRWAFVTSCPLPFGPTGLADGLAQEDALCGSRVRDSPRGGTAAAQFGSPVLAARVDVQTRRLTCYFSNNS